MIRKIAIRIAGVFVFTIIAHGILAAQQLDQTYPLGSGGAYRITNVYGRVTVIADKETASASLTAASSRPFSRSDIKVESTKDLTAVSVTPSSPSARIDLTVKVPVRSEVRIESTEGEVRFSGDFKEIRAETTAGTVIADLPLDNLRYKFLWTAARPRIVSDAELAVAEERNAGKSVIEGELTSEAGGELVDVEVRTGRGIVLLNVDPSEVPSSLTERPLTEAAKAMIRSGDLLLSEAIRRAAPKYFGDYAATLPPRRTGPELVNVPQNRAVTGAGLKTVNVQVTDANNRAVGGLSLEDFELAENGVDREVVSVETTTAPFNLVLLLDVSGSVENYVDFIRKAARNFVETVDKQDRVAIVIFNDDINRLSDFSTDRSALSESLDTFDAGGGTAYYDALGYVLAETLEKLKGERTAIVVLTDGEDNRSFLSFPSLVGSLQESGSLVYPLYVPVGVIARSVKEMEEKVSALGVRDPLRERYMSLTLSDKAEDEGQELARVSGGVYYPISKVSELQQAYDDIVRQLRTAYTVTYRSASSNGVPARLRVKVKKEGMFVRFSSASR